MNGPITETAVWSHQFQVSFVGSPSGGGSVGPTGSGIWEDAGTLSVQATPNAGYSFSSWSSDNAAITFGSQTASAVATIGGPGTITATFTSNSVGVTITSSPGGSGYVVVDGVTIATPTTFQWQPGSIHTLSATANVTVGAGERYSFTSWSDSGARVHSYTVTSNPTTITANFDHQYLLTMATNSGTTSPSVGTHWYNAGTQVTLDATAPTAVQGEQYPSLTWAGSGSGSYDGSSNPTSVTMNGPITETATWVHQFQLTTTTNFGSVVPASKTWYPAGATVTLTATPPSTVTGERYLFSSWAGSGSGSYDGSSNPTSVTMNGPITENAVWSHQFQVSFAVAPPGGGTVSPTGSNVWENAGPVSLVASPSAGYSFSSWGASDAGKITFDSQSSSTQATIGGPGTITASFSVLPVGVTITSSPTGTGYVLVDGVATTTPKTFNWLPGETHTLEAVASVSISSGEQYLFSSWSDAGARVHTFTVSASTVTVTASFAHQYLLTMAASGGSTTPSVGTHWYNAGSQVTLDATAQAAGTGMQYVWNTWTGSGTGSYSGTNKLATNAVSVNAPITETASWTTQYLVSFNVSPSGAGSTTPSGSVWRNAGPVSISATPSAGYSFSSWTSNNTSITFGAQTASTTANINTPGTITATFVVVPVSVTITSGPAGSGYVLVDGVATATPKTFSWLPGSTHALEAIANVTVGTGERYSFSSWSDSGARVHSYKVPAASATVTASFAHQYLLTMAANGGTTTPSLGAHWYNAGSLVTLDATGPSSGAGFQYVWKAWTGAGTGSYTGTSKPATNALTMNGAVTETASWTKQYQISFGATPAGAGAINRTGTGWFSPGPLSIKAIPSKDYAFSTWTSGTAGITFNSQSATTTVNVNGSGTITANFVLALGITITSNPTGPGYLTVDGSPITSPANFNWTLGSTHTIQALTVPAKAGERYVFTSWSDGGAQTHTYTVTALTATIIATFEHQYLLTMATNVGTTTPAPGTAGAWYGSGSTVRIGAAAPGVGAANERYLWAGWTGVGSGNYSGTAGPSVDVVMDGPITETARWTHQYQITMATNYGTTSPEAGNPWMDAGSPVTLTATAPDQGTGERYIFNGWTGTGTGAYTGTANPATNAVVVNGPITETASWTLQQVPGAPIGLTAISGDGLVTLNWTAPFDGGVPIDVYVVYQDGQQVSAVTSLSTTITGLTNGQTYTFTVLAHNAIGIGPISSEVLIRPVIGQTGLILEITSPRTGSYVQGSVTLEWKAADFSSNLVKMEVSGDGASWTTVSGSRGTLNGLTDGPRTLYVRATDAANSVVTRSVVVIVDSIAPQVTVTSPIFGTYMRTQTSTVNWIVSETGSGLARTELSLDGGNWTVQAGNSATITVSEGAHTLYVRATDNAGNVMTATVPFTVDMTAPTILAASPSDGNQSMLATIQVTFSEAMDKTSTSVKIDDLKGIITWNGNNLTFTPSDALKGRTTYSVTAYGADLAGNSVVLSWSFRTATVGKISGILLGHDGNPLADTVVILIAQGTASRTEMNHLALIISGVSGTEWNTTTDANGAYAFYDVAIGNYSLEYTEKGYLPKTTEVVMTSEAVDSGGLRLDPGASVYNPNNGLMLNLAVVSVSAAMAGIFLFIRRRRRLSTTGPGPKTTEVKAQAVNPEGKAPEEKSTESLAMQDDREGSKEK